MKPADGKAPESASEKRDREKSSIGGGTQHENSSPEASLEVESTSQSSSQESPELNEKERPVQGPYVTPSDPMETVLAMPSPSESAEAEKRKKPPHLQAPQYVHHFDTWSLVRDVEKGGFKHLQAVELMKAMRSILAENLDVARDGLVSKSNVENETYLFRAACSELRTEIQNNRKGEMEKMRAQRTQLQHEVDILNQKMSQGMQNMKDDLKGLFDDRKMNVKMEQKNMENRVCLPVALQI